MANIHEFKPGELNVRINELGKRAVNPVTIGTVAGIAEKLGIPLEEAARMLSVDVKNVRESVSDNIVL